MEKMSLDRKIEKSLGSINLINRSYTVQRRYNNPRYNNMAHYNYIFSTDQKIL